MRGDYEAWLKERFKNRKTVSNYLAELRRIEKHYGALDEIIKFKGLDGLLAELRYSAEDRDRDRPNPSKLPILGDLYKHLNTYRTTVRLYAQFRESREA